MVWHCTDAHESQEGEPFDDATDLQIVPTHFLSIPVRSAFGPFILAQSTTNTDPQC